MTNGLERTIIDLIATDRMYMPSSSFDGKLERSRPKIAKQITSYDGFDREFEGNRVYAKLRTGNTHKARGIRAGVEEFAKRFPQYGKVLNGIIEEKRLVSERNLHFGMKEGKRVTHDDYMAVLLDMGLTEKTAEDYYTVAIKLSRELNKKRNGQKRSILVK